ncbi:helicase and polymerase-containing protein TEBICHI-like isoform X2 [Carica papaya]|uniref:helicase and polymerase-containing protein TEBICHI-like isoform X2 n=1 Tax=Carica papaya TaxID=3649 RepID=UPI000B8C8866|nr:helicase and polymerase-containing protein TEBICHI-like isoform X2 [Carica papaya]
MASDSSRTRIDQFFASRKRKSLSPGLKSGRVGKNAKVTVCSPSAKGSLDDYLKVPLDDNNAAKSSYKASGSLTRKDAVKRTLVSEINKLPEADKEKKQASIPTHIHMEASGVEGTLKRASQNSGAQDFVKGCSVSTDDAENLELKQFATDFLSLYCSELQSSLISCSGSEANDYKILGSPSLMVGEDKASKKKNSMSSQLQADNLMAYPNQKNLKNMPSGFTYKIKEFACSSLKQVIDSEVPIDLPSSLRKCNKASKSFVNTNECHTPGSSIIKMCALETPKSARGSSIFSPGEGFWNEAIQVADGLFLQTDSFAAAEIKYGNNQYETNNSYSLKNMDCDEKMKIPAEGESRVQGVRVGVSLPLLEKRKKDNDKEVSPLPVKHFDFLSEDKNGDGSSPRPCVADTLEDVACRDNELSECGSVICKVPQPVVNLEQNCDVQTTEQILSVQERTFDHPMLEGKVDLSTQDNNALFMSNSSINDIRKPVGNGESDEASTLSSFMMHKNNLELSNWLPSEICNIYRKKGISKLYPWQVECLQVDGVLQRRNLVYCASTSAGKSFVAEILMLRQVISSGKMALLVLPYVSICAEKAEHLELLLEPLGKHVRSYYGIHGGGTLPKDTSVAVCTIEKANSLINRLLEEGRLSEIGIIIIDELHMVGDQSRGYLLELMLTKLRYAGGEGSSETSSGESSGPSGSKVDALSGIQMVGMSATMPNVAAVADWLQAALYQTDYRPVPLEEYIKIGDSIYNKRLEIVRTIPKAADLGGKDPDHIVELCNEVVQEGHSVLIFCSSRKGCESTARHVAKFITKFSVSFRENNSDFVDIASAIDALKRSPAGVDPILEETLPFGVAYHHAGLTVEEREIVESCYRRGLYVF